MNMKRALFYLFLLWHINLCCAQKTRIDVPVLPVIQKNDTTSEDSIQSDSVRIIKELERTLSEEQKKDYGNCLTFCISSVKIHAIGNLNPIILT